MAFAMIMPNALKISAEETPTDAPVLEPALAPDPAPAPVVTEAEPLAAVVPMALPYVYNSDDGFMVVEAFFGTSTNDHTMLNGLVWIQNGELYVAVKSTHMLELMQINGHTEYPVHVYPAGESIKIDGTTYPPTDLNGNTKDSHFTVFIFPRSVLVENNWTYVRGIGRGHDVEGEIKFYILPVDLTIAKQWIGGPANPAKTATFKIYGVAPSGTDVIIAMDAQKNPINPLTITGPTDAGFTNRAIKVPRTTLDGEIYTSYYIRELDGNTVIGPGGRTSEGYVVTYDATGLKVTNTYTLVPANATIAGTKTLVGRPLLANEFSFILKDAQGVQIGTAVKNAANGSFSFPALQFTAPGVYTFYIAELPGALPGVTYDTADKKITVTVTDDGKGNLSAVVSPVNVPITNTYKPDPVSVTIRGTKSLTGRPLLAGEFSFILKDDFGQVGVAVFNAADGSFSFPALGFSSVGTYTFKIVEQSGSLGGVTYDLSEKIVTVKVTDDLKGKLVAQVTPENTLITNTYKAAPVDVTIGGTKTLVGRPLLEKEFSFILKDAQGVPIGMAVYNAADGSFSFPALKITEPGIYTFKVAEVAGSLGGVTYDTTDKIVTVTVTDDLKGHLVAVVSPQNVSITNTYKAGSTSIILSGTKMLSGRPLVAGEFTFELWKDGAEEPWDEAKNDVNGLFAFDALNFTQPGTYTYYVREVLGSLGGVTYDTKMHKIVVTVVDNLDGTLTATAKYPEGGLVFLNSYKPAPTRLDLEGMKTLSGRPLVAGEFTFELWMKGGLEPLDTAVNAADGKFSFDAQMFDKAGVFTFLVKEKAGSLGGVTYDDTLFEITVTVVDNLDGTLTATPKYPEGGLLFENTYKPGLTRLALQGMKELTGRPLVAGEFIFELWEKGGEMPILTAVNTADGKFMFDAIAYEEPGTYEYLIKEKAGTLGGVTYDEAIHAVTVKVVDNLDGTLTATAKYPEGGLIFKNSYKPAPTSIILEGMKNLVGRPLVPGEFTFELWKKGDEMPFLTAVNGADGKFAFAAIPYDKPGTYEYLIKEKVETLGGVTYDVAIHPVTVKVVDNLDGTLTATAKYPEGGLLFMNSYKPAPTRLVLEGMKTLSGRPLVAGEFTFELWMKGGLEPLDTAVNAADGKFSFDAQMFDKAGVFTFLVKEKVGSLGGVTYDDTLFEITVTVKDNLDGTLTATPTYPEGGLLFENTYKPGLTRLALQGMKELTGRPLVAGEFTFELWEKGGEMPILTAVNTADGKFMFEAIAYEEPGTYEYLIKETVGTLGGVTYDEAIHAVTVKVVDNLDGTLTAKATYPEGGLVFENSYEPAPTSIILEGLKNLDGRPLVAGEFTFELWELEGEAPLKTAVNDADGKFMFEALHYTEPGTYEYLVKETAEDLGGVTYDAAVIHIMVKVVDNLDGTLTATAIYPEGGLVFENSYKAEPTTLIIEGLKELIGRPLLAEEFTFELWEMEGEEALLTAKNAADGKFAFAPLEFDQPGTYHFMVVEVKGMGYAITYDETVFHVKVEVVDNLDGTLTATATYSEAEAIVFTNSYDVVDVGGEKLWDDLGVRPAKVVINLYRNGELYDDMEVVPGEGGKWFFTFEDLAEFDPEGEPYLYTVEEVPVAGYVPTVNGFNITNRLLRATARIIKIDDADDPVAGVEFEIYDKDSKLVFKGKTNAEGILEVELPLGTYTVKETAAPKGYIIDDEIHTVVLSADKTTVELEVVNILEIEDVEPKPLPQTGSAGTGVFYLMGVLTLLGGAFLLRKKRSLT
ncbi:Spy0128 family protein [Proteiniclasticum sediminis]|uniref:Spy0128 family protein n=1 Tax=Proteiniclasticum sediminis TaxID=2804028 RepID=UPI001BAA631C|nr:FctA domain-containing protein [Proteiniclasticum sediminis]